MGEFIKKKKFKIKIRCTADKYEGSVNGKTFSQAVNYWWVNSGMPSLVAELAKPVNDNSYLQDFVFESDSDDKESYD